MSENTSVRPEGLITFWSLPEDLAAEGAEAALRPALSPPWDPSHMPQRRSPAQALSRAMALHERPSRRGSPAWVSRRDVNVPGKACMVEERGGVGGNIYRVLFSASLRELRDPAGVQPPIFSIDMDYTSMKSSGLSPEDFKTSYEKALGTVSPAAMGSWLSKKAAEAGAVSLRPSGGVYWVPTSAQGAWERLADAVEEAYVHDARVYLIRHRMDEETATGVVTRVREALSAEIAEMEERVFKEAPGKRTADAINRRIDSMLVNIVEYERCLAAELGDVRERAERARAVRATSEVLIISGVAS